MSVIMLHFMHDREVPVTYSGALLHRVLKAHYLTLNTSNRAYLGIKSRPSQNVFKLLS